MATSVLLGWTAVAGAGETTGAPLATPSSSATIDQVSSSPAPAIVEGPLLIPAGLSSPKTALEDFRPVTPNPSAANAEGSAASRTIVAPPTPPQRMVPAPYAQVRSAPQAAPPNRSYSYVPQQTRTGTSPGLPRQQQPQTTATGAYLYNYQRPRAVRLPDGRIVMETQARTGNSLPAGTAQWSGASSGPAPTSPRSWTSQGQAAAQQGRYQQRPSTYYGYPAGQNRASSTSQAAQPPKSQGGWSSWNPFLKMSETLSSWFSGK